MTEFRNLIPAGLVNIGDRVQTPQGTGEVTARQTRETATTRMMLLGVELAPGDDTILMSNPADKVVVLDTRPRNREHLGIHYNEDGVPDRLACRTCGGPIVEHDRADRENPIDLLPPEGSPGDPDHLRLAAVVRQQGGPHWEVVAYQCGVCETHYELPEGIVLDWT